MLWLPILDPVLEVQGQEESISDIAGLIPDQDLDHVLDHGLVTDAGTPGGQGLEWCIHANIDLYCWHKQQLI